MSEVTLEAIEQLLETKLEQKLEPINIKLEAIQETLSEHTEILKSHDIMLKSHSVALDALAKDVKNLNQAQNVNNVRFDKNEKAVKFVAQKVGVL